MSDTEPDATTNDDPAASSDERAPDHDEGAVGESARGDGRLSVVGLGPGSPEEMTARARETLWLAEELVGYDTYVDLLPDPLIADAEAVHATGMGEEVSRVETAIDRAAAGSQVALVGSGDPNVYALAGLVLEVLESRGMAPDDVGFEAVPGVPAAQAAAARLGAPIVGDAASVSLSDRLTPAEEIESRLEAVASEGFAIALYNPWSPGRTDLYRRCCEILLDHRAPDTPVGVVRAAGREDEATRIVDLEDLPDLGETDLVDMTTTILVGTEDTEVVDGRMITPRGYGRKYDY
ncbi:MAG: precorrin-3B C17-methyltransferase [Halobacteriales archaeon]|jgi:precorrin-3B C17-methyltransferase